MFLVHLEEVLCVSVCVRAHTRVYLLQIFGLWLLRGLYIEVSIIILSCCSLK